MQGYVEESELVKAKRALLQAAREYGGHYLGMPYGDATEQAETRLIGLACRFARALAEDNRPQRRRSTHDQPGKK
jgi:hypothetical protein